MKGSDRSSGDKKECDPGTVTIRANMKEHLPQIGIVASVSQIGADRTATLSMAYHKGAYAASVSDLHEGDCLAIGPHVYEIQRISIAPKATTTTPPTLGTSNGFLCVKELQPRGGEMAPDIDNLVAIMGGTGTFAERDWQLVVKEILVEQGGALAASVQVRPDPLSQSAGTPRSVQLHVDDVIDIGGRDYRVMRMKPEEKAIRLRGWVELRRVGESRSFQSSK